MARRRKHSKIDGLPPELRETVEQMLLANNCTYAEVIDYMASKGVSISAGAVCNHAKNLRANVEQLNIASTNFKYLMDEMEKYPELDTTEAIVRLLSQNALQAIASKSNDDWNNMDAEKLMREANALIRAAAYKKRVDLQNQTDVETGVDAVKQMLFDALASERPDLYDQVSKFFEAKGSSLTAEED
ncbi:DUF3486 family protein [Christensenellaceae bacterium OttesenSCG-928-M15]|nr:DUF3486 family protein [Christensenellaceae bacterium OttesenSCG-928-M15]